MDLFFPILFLIIGFVLIIKGGDLFVDSAVWLAKKTGLPEIVVGATVVSVGTTIPEILVSVIAVIKGLADPLEVQAYSELAIGNAVGSMLCNIALILSIVLIVRPPKTEGRSFNEKGIALIFVTMLFMVFALTGNVIVPIEGVILLVAFVAFLTLNYYDAKRDMILNKDLSCVSDAKAKANEQNSFLMISLFIIGAAAIGIGAYLLVDKGQELALMLGVPSQVIAITVLAIGTSLPELVTSLTSLRKGTCEMGLGNIGCRCSNRFIY